MVAFEDSCHFYSNTDHQDTFLFFLLAFFNSLLLFKKEQLICRFHVQALGNIIFELQQNY